MGIKITEINYVEWTCDVCGKVEKFENAHYADSQEPPKGWLFMRMMIVQPDAVPWRVHFWVDNNPSCVAKAQEQIGAAIAEWNIARAAAELGVRET